ncbi:MAG TPA: hypothetical protein VNI01_08815 [Elusimicrobiota bacterium]|jgi:hypothetical protein|nr:hypothetical protein [Elusimicrobiota bacterium]
MDRTALALAAAACLVLLAGAALWALAPARAGFYTPFSREEPTRPYLAYTGTPPVGPWGAAPWAEAAPRAPAARAARPCA